MPARGERHRVDGVDVAAGPGEHHRLVRRGAVEVGAGRHAPLGHGRFVEAAAEQPAPAGSRARKAATLRDERRDALDPAQVEHRRQQMPDLPDVGVGVVEGGHDGAAAQVDPPRAGARAAVATLGVADGDDPAVADDDRGRATSPNASARTCALWRTRSDVRPMPRPGVRRPRGSPGRGRRALRAACPRASSAAAAAARRC